MSTLSNPLRLAALPLLLALASQLTGCGGSEVAVDASVTAGAGNPGTPGTPVTPPPVDEPPCLAI